MHRSMLRCLNLNRSHINNILRYSTSVKLKDPPSEDTSLKESIKQSSRISKMRTIVKNRKPQRPPFVKNLFLGVLDTELLAYPEALDKTNIETLFATLTPLEEYFAKSETEILASNGLTKDYTAALNNLHLMGLKASQLSGGKELNVTEACLHYEKILHCGSNNNYLAHELLGLQTVLKFATKEQKDTYLDGVISGRIITGLCVVDPLNLPDNDCKTKAVFDSQSNTWTLNGTKSFVINGNTAELFVVTAETKFLSENGLAVTGISVFFVDKSSLGLSTSKQASFGIKGLDVAEIKFDNVEIPHANVIGKPNQAENVLRGILLEYRLSTGPALIALTKKMSHNMINWIKQYEPTESTDYTTAESVYMLISNITKSIYAMESMTYFTSGLLDIYEEQDCELEASIVRIFSIEQCHENALNCLKIIGSPGFVPTHWSNEIYRDATTYSILNESLKTLKLSTALLGLQYSGIKMQEIVTSVRNPMFFPMHAVKRMMQLRHHQTDSPKMVLGLKYYLHPSLTVAADAIEYCVLRLHFATEVLFSHYGNESVTKHIDLERLADAVVDIYAMITSAARASRSYCIGLRHGDQEILLATAICITKKEKVRKCINNLVDGAYINMDANFLKIGKKSIQENQYHLVHPITRNF